MTTRKALTILWILVFLLGGGKGIAQKERSAAAVKKLVIPPIAQFGFTQLYGGVIVVRATLDNLPDSLNFILDTGSGGISLDSATAMFLGVTTEPSSRTIRGIAGVKKVEFAYNHTLNLPGLTVDSLDFHINDYEMLSGVYGIQVDGIIGYSFFKRYVVGVNFDSRTISIYPPGAFSYPKMGHLIRPAISGLPMQYAEITDNNWVPGRFYIDTGAGLCLLLSERFVSDSTLFIPGKTIYKSVAEGIGGKKEMSVTVVKKFKLGPYRFKQMPTYVFDDDFNVTNYPFLGGLIGNDLLRRFNLIINYGKSEFHLLPNKSYQEPFDYAYTGFNMFQEGYDVIIMDVMKDSPADRAGLKDGDIIVSIGNKFASNLQGYKDVLQQPGNRLNIVVSRDKKLEEKKLIIGNIKKKKIINKEQKL
jgi:hypothetical protein